ncbi:cysteine hydrolase family protein [Rhodococcus pyridinivorans]|uniref:cysteine hydrolase family protein n=1 Tax=Rhodococcus pyridinivorans TaxID=103816 RepID=UPI001E5D84B9|nr:isochorismatase family cysteine hydrolase [Rhodococcus pyridinivorans]MCD5422752.1 cysteine hydrolase [Rhodococcus pyridinivorans]
MTNQTALVLLDWINEIVDPRGRLAAKGYAHYIDDHAVYPEVQREIDRARDGRLVIAVGLGFAPGYVDQPTSSPVFGKAREFGILEASTWSTEYTTRLTLPPHTVRLRKNRVSAFSSSLLDQLLRLHGVTTVRLAGVATDLAVEATARSAHDLDYSVEVLAAGCAAATRDDHERALTSMAKFASIV